MATIVGEGALPQVSIIIPVYNHAHQIKKAIYSVLSQTFQDFELVVVNDGSIDNLEEVLAEFTNIKVVWHEKNLGRAAARNSGILASSGQYVAFLDADDQWMPDKLAMQVRYLEENPEISICLTGFQFVYTNGQKRNTVLQNSLPWKKYLLKHIRFPDGTIPMYTRACIEEIGLQDIEFPWHENWEWLFRASLTHKIGTINDILVIKKQGGKYPPAAIKEDAAIKFITKHKKVFQEFGMYGRSAIAMKWYDLSIAFFRERNNRKGIAYLLKAWFLWPLQSLGYYLRLIDVFLGTKFEELARAYKHNHSG